jgi:hypothetical protein
MTCTGSLGNAPQALSAWLLEQDYSQHCRERIIAHADFHGCLAGCPELDPADEAVATEIFIDALPSIPQTSSEWCDGGMEYTLPDEEIEALLTDEALSSAAAHDDTPPEPWPTEAEIAEYEAEEWCYPPRRQVSPEELSQRAAHGAI